MSSSFAVFVSRRLQATAAAILCLAAVQLVETLTRASPAPSAPAGVRGELRR